MDRYIFAGSIFALRGCNEIERAHPYAARFYPYCCGDAFREGIMDIRQIECFVAVARKGNYTKAAEELFVSRQALSKTVKHLEKIGRAHV